MIQSILKNEKNKYGDKKIYTAALIGTGSRGIHMFAEPILKEYSDTVNLIALFDINILRMKAANKILTTNLPMYENFDQMMNELNPDILIVTSKDSTHAEFIIKGLNLNKIVYSEKPACTTVEQINLIRAAVKKSTGHLFVTHNMRYGANMIKIKELIDEGVIGKVLTIDFRETLDRNHGADYFRRWHGKKENSGGLLIHKSSHHFDVINWFAGSRASKLNARGSTAFYGKSGPFRGKRCSDCQHADECVFHFDLKASKVGNMLYREPEVIDGYFRDSCLFDEKITTEDNAGVVFTYENGVLANYSLNAFASYEGMLISIEGTEGRIEFESVKSTQWTMGSNVVHGQEKSAGSKLTLIHPTKGVTEINVAKREGGHGGSDPALRDDFFRNFLNELKAQEHMASAEDGLQAVLIGAAANHSIEQDSKTIDVQGLLKF